MKYKLNFYTQYNQFYISDSASSKNTGDINFWTKEANSDRLAYGDGILGVGIESYGHVKSELRILKNVNNNVNYSEYDHIVEGGLQIRSGVLEVFSCPTFENQLKIQLEPGNYRVRIYSSHLLNTVSDEYEGNDHYIVEIWPDNNLERRVLKRYIR